MSDLTSSLKEELSSYPEDVQQLALMAIALSKRSTVKDVAARLDTHVRDMVRSQMEGEE